MIQKVMKTIGSFSTDPKEQARQTRDLEQNTKTSHSSLEKRVSDLEARLAELAERVTALEP